MEHFLISLCFSCCVHARRARFRCRAGRLLVALAVLAVWATRCAAETTELNLRHTCSWSGVIALKNFAALVVRVVGMQLLAKSWMISGFQPKEAISSVLDETSRYVQLKNDVLLRLKH